MSAPDTLRRCRSCKKGHLSPVVWQRTFSPLGKLVVVELLNSECSHCGSESTSSQQHNENLASLRARKSHYGHLLMGEEIVAFRMKYGLTQKLAARIFGKKGIAFSRYENETSYPDLSTTKLLKQAIAHPQVLKSLADEEGVEIPLWTARCEDERRKKRTEIRAVPASTDDVLAWQKLRKEPDRHRSSLWPAVSSRTIGPGQHFRIEPYGTSGNGVQEVKAS